MSVVRSPDTRTAGPPVAAATPSHSPRLLSLDVTRGLAIAAMLVMNHPGSWDHTYGPLQHAEWHGWTPTDLVFPIFLFIVGVSMPFSVAALISQGATRGQIMARAGRRAAVLFLLGLGLVTFPWWHLDLGAFRIPGVLQRIALSFLLAAPVVVWLRVRAQVAVVAALLLGYWALMAWVPVPGVGAGIWEPGRDLGSYIDRTVLGANHLWPGQDWDPLGLLGTLPAVANVLLGALAGRWLRAGRPGDQVIAGLTLCGIAAIAVGMLWSAAFPINKNLWTSSYAVFATGWALLLMALCYWLVEVRSRRRLARPFGALGVNAILIYVAASLADAVSWRIPVGSGHSLRSAVYRVLFESWLAPMHASLAFAVVFVSAWIVVAMALDRRGIRIKV